MNPRSRAPFRSAALGVWLALAGAALPASASNKYLEIPSGEEARNSRAYRYANLSDAEALAELKRRGIPYRPATERTPGVRLPIRLTGPIRGVTIYGTLPAHERKTSVFEVLDARLAIALDDFCRILSQHDVVELVHFTMYRPAAERAPDADTPQTRHPGGMAIDVGALKKKNGRWMAVGPHWSTLIGEKTCGQGARALSERAGRELMSIVCEAYDQRIFHYMLSPHFDKAHADHLHLEIKPQVKWFIAN